MEPEKRKVYIRIMREAREKTEFERLRENKRREKTGVAPLPRRILNLILSWYFWKWFFKIMQESI